MMTPSAAARLERAIVKSEHALRQGDATGRLMALQDVRLALYGLPLADVSAPARTASATPTGWRDPDASRSAKPFR
ncbi:hypothetical protein ACQPZP_26500 [Spirillospora sp. CA-142024]|uniref:hypothetical protein n=1 Tax=Spirillospora sp. CA-142024 TaxID=3240036 RepID=UPI003D8A9BA8